MNILISARGYDTRRGHEIGIFELDQAKALRGAGHDVRIAAIDARSIRHRRPWGCREYTLDDLCVVYAAVPAGALPGEIMGRAQRFAAGQIWKRLQKDGWRPDIIHSHFGDGLLETAKREKIPFVYTEHFSGANGNHVAGKELAREKKLYGELSRLLAVSTPLADSLYRHTGVRAAVVPNIVDTQAFPLPSGDRTPGNVFHFVSVGGLLHRKGYDLLLQALSELKKEGFPVSLTVFGDGEEREALASLAAKLDTAAVTEFRGNQPRAVIAEEFARADAFVLPSRLETFGVVYIEAMAAGLPVIATRCGGPEDFVNEENGLLIPVDDVRSLTDAMRDMIKNRARYDSAAIAAGVRESFSPERIARALTAIYEECLSC